MFFGKSEAEIRAAESHVKVILCDIVFMPAIRRYPRESKTTVLNNKHDHTNDHAS